MKNNMVNLKRQTKKMEEGINVKKVLSITGILIIVLVLFFVFKSGKKEYNYDNLSVYKNSNQIELSNQDKETITAYLTRSKFNKVESTCDASNLYVIKFDSIELSFANDDCGVLFKNIYTEENYITNLEDELKDYIIDLTK